MAYLLQDLVILDIVHANHRVTVTLFGHDDPDIAAKLIWANADAAEEATFNTLSLPDDRYLPRVVADVRPHVIFSFGDVQRYQYLHIAPIDTRRRWVHFDVPPPPEQLAIKALEVFIDVSTNDRFPDQPLVSVFTRACRSGDVLNRPFGSLIAQTYPNWEWVVYDDSPYDHHDTWKRLNWLAANEPRVQIFRGNGNNGRLGEVKRRLCGLTRGRILVELDHDDELTDHCVADLVEGFERFPDAGFAYTDLAEVMEGGEPAMYPDGWGFGFGSYRSEVYQAMTYQVTNFPPVNAKTIRHVAGIPSCARAWRRDIYEDIKWPQCRHPSC